MTSLTEAQADMFFSKSRGVGLSLLRIRIAPDGTTTETSIAKQAVKRGAKVWATPWSPPAKWKSNRNVNHGGYLCDGIVCSPSHYANYAAQLANFAVTIEARGVPLYAISVQNEPDQSVSYESCLWTEAEFKDFVPYLYTALSNAGVSHVKLLLPEPSAWGEIATYDSWMATDTATAGQVGVIAGHNYDRNLATAQATYGKELWETEYSTFDAYDGSMTNGIAFATHMHSFMTTASVNAYHYW
jgi:glucuronoarabinoxylan endo-1,4-beta-xylanase